MRIIFRTSSHKHQKIKLKISPYDCLKNLKKMFKNTIITVVGDGLSSAQISNYKKIIGQNNFIEINLKNNSKSLKYCIDLALGFQKSSFLYDLIEYLLKSKFINFWSNVIKSSM